MQMTNIFRKELNTFSISADNREVLSWFLNAYSKFKAESLDSNLNYKTELCTLSSLYFLNKMLFVFFPVLRLALQVQKQQWMLLFSRSVVSDHCDPMNHSTQGLPVHHQLLEFTQTQVHRVGDPIQPSHPLLSPSPPALNLSQHQGLFKWVSSSHQVAKVLEFQLWHQSYQWTPRTDLL